MNEWCVYSVIFKITTLIQVLNNNFKKGKYILFLEDSIEHTVYLFIEQIFSSIFV